MLDIKFIRDNPEAVKKAIADRNMTFDLDVLIDLDNVRRKLIIDTEAMRSRRNELVAIVQKEKDEKAIAESKKLKEELSELEKELEETEKEWTKLMGQVPNLIHPEAPIGAEADFKVISKHGEPTKFDFKAKDHEVLMTSLDLIDFERGVKVTGPKFYFLKNQAILLNRALIQYGLKILIEHGFTLVETPDMAKNEVMAGTGYNPRGNEQQIYTVEGEDLSLIATAEITMGGYHSDDVLDLEKGPLKYAAISHCFRREAGAYGKASKGLYRVHQFEKLEMFIYCKPEDSEKLHKELLAIEQEIVDGLEIPYRVIDTPSGDLGAPAYRKFDLEAWMTMKGDKDSQGDYGEITSTSNCTDYQARRLNIKYKKPDGSKSYVHTLNGTAVVLSRFPIAIYENYQQADGSIKVPKVLQEFTGFDVIKKQ